MGEHGFEKRSEGEPSPEFGPQAGWDTTGLRSDDGRAEMVLARRDGCADLRQFRTERSGEGADSAHVLMDRAERSGVEPPRELAPGPSPHPEFVDLLRDEPASVRFWNERASRDAFGTRSAEEAEAVGVAEHMAENAEGRPDVPPFEPPERWVQDVNAPGADAPGRDANCVFCSLATEQRWRGSPVSAGDWPHKSGLSVSTAEKLVGPLSETSPSAIDQTLRDAGPGSSGMVAVEWPTGGGHMMNVVNDGGTIRWVDGQNATIDMNPPAATSYRWNARDAKGRQL